MSPPPSSAAPSPSPWADPFGHRPPTQHTAISSPGGPLRPKPSRYRTGIRFEPLARSLCAAPRFQFPQRIERCSTSYTPGKPQQQGRHSTTSSGAEAIPAIESRARAIDSRYTDRLSMPTPNGWNDIAPSLRQLAGPCDVELDFFDHVRRPGNSTMLLPSGSPLQFPGYTRHLSRYTPSRHHVGCGDQSRSDKQPQRNLHAFSSRCLREIPCRTTNLRNRTERQRSFPGSDAHGDRSAMRRHRRAGNGQRGREGHSRRPCGRPSG